MSGKPITITATVGAWLPEYRKPHELVTLLENGDAVGVVNCLHVYGPADREEFSNWVRVGEADVTLRLLPQDEQVRLAVEGLKRKLDEERGKWLARQQEILADISKLQALEYVAPEGGAS